MKELYGADKVEQVLAQNPINRDHGLRLRDVHRLTQLMIDAPVTHHHKHKTVHPLPAATSSNHPSTTSTSTIQSSGDSPPSSTSSNGNIGDSPIQAMSSVDEKHMQAVKLLEEKSAHQIAAHFVKEGHSRNITRENVTSKINEEFQQLSSTKEPFLCKVAFMTKIQGAINHIIEDPSFSNEETPTMQIRVNRRACRLNTLLLSFILEGKGNEVIETKKAAQDIVGAILINCPSKMITYELLHDYVVNASMEGNKFHFNPKLPYYLSKAVCDFLIDETTTEEAKLPFRKRFTALNTLLSSPKVLQQLQGMECLSSAPAPLCKTALPAINRSTDPTRSITELEVRNSLPPATHQLLPPIQSMHQVVYPIHTISYHPATGVPIIVRN